MDFLLQLPARAQLAFHETPVAIYKPILVAMGGSCTVLYKLYFKNSYSKWQSTGNVIAVNNARWVIHSASHIFAAV